MPDQLDRSLALVEPLAAGLPPSADVAALDLGSGGGLPGLVLALALPRWRWSLLDGSVRRTAWLAEAVATLDLGSRVTVIATRAEEAGRSGLRHGFDRIVARGFAAPAPTAECAAPLLRQGGVIVVTEPPGGAPGRWDSVGLAELGLTLAASTLEPVATQSLRTDQLCPERYPRRNGIPVKRPLWT